MRRSVLVVLSLAACAVPNPLFGVDDAGSAGTTRASDEPATGPGPASTTTTTTTPPTTTMGPGDATVEPTTAGVGDTEVVSTLETSAPTLPGTTDLPPGTTGTDTTDSADTTTEDPDTGPLMTLPEPSCVYAVGILPNRLVKQDGEPMACDETKHVFRGPIDNTNGVIFLTDYKDCGNNQIQDPSVHELGSGWEPMNIDATCVTATVYWDPTKKPACEIGAMVVQRSENNIPGDYLMFASFAPNQNQTTLKPVFKPYMPCGCPMDMPNCCGDLPPGDYKLAVLDQVEVHPGHTEVITYDGAPMKFHNMGSYVAESCEMHADWVAFRGG